MAEFPAPPPPPPPGFSTGPSGPRSGFWRRFAALFIDGVAYFTYFEGSASGQTIGKRALGIRVIDFNTGGPIGHGRALIRNLARILSGLFCDLGYLWMLWDKEKQTWHDKIASDVVVPVESYPVASWPN
jgi:uncharacterized RDD family membrane protein YckC